MICPSCRGGMSLGQTLREEGKLNQVWHCHHCQKRITRKKAAETGYGGTIVIRNFPAATKQE